MAKRSSQAAKHLAAIKRAKRADAGTFNCDAEVVAVSDAVDAAIAGGMGDMVLADLDGAIALFSFGDGSAMYTSIYDGGRTLRGAKAKAVARRIGMGKAVDPDARMNAADALCGGDADGALAILTAAANKALGLA